ncbi:hypothetical protein CF328_g9361 [Tilletia controversa]|nr:hypothetical protein CF328_g9361 [Tilletia controversa]
MTYGGLNQVLNEHRAVDKRRRASSSVAGAPMPTRQHTPTPFFPPSIRGATDDLPSHVAICEERYITASNRIFRWAPSPGPASSLSTSSGLNFDPSGLMRGAVTEVLEFSLEESTCVSYSTAIIKYCAFCDSAGIPIQDRCPPSSGLLLAFVSSFVAKIRADTAKKYLGAVATWHRLWGHDWVIFPQVTYALRGLKHFQPPANDLRPPILAAHLHAVKAHLDIDSDPLHAAVWACSLFSWWAVCRLAETTSPSTPSFTPSRNATRASVQAHRQVLGGKEIVRVDLPWTKTTKEKGQQKHVVKVGGALCPVEAFDNHLRLSPVPVSELSTTALFAFRSSSMPGSTLVLPLSKTKFLTTFNAALVRSGQEAFQGHSFRIGGATMYWHTGTDIKSIKLIGGWKGNSVLKYLREYARGLLPAHERAAAAIAEAAPT